MVETDGRRRSERIIESIRLLPEIQLPSNKAEIGIFKTGLVKVVNGETLKIYVGSCPDYSHNGVRYTHQSLGDRIPLLTQYHLEADRSLLGVLENEGIEYEMVVMVADVEATDEVFCMRFTDGDETEFLARCARSVVATRGAIVTPRIKSSSFFAEFGRERFLDLQMRYSRLLAEKFETDGSFHCRVVADTFGRYELYRKMYPDVFNDGMTVGQREEFLIDRTMRTMAQYLTLGRLISEVSGPVAIINHPTTNKNMYNSRGKFLLPEDDPRYPQPTVPVFTMARKVY